jgi:hypothetical protein
MKFSVASLLWLATLVAVILGAYFWAQEQKTLANRKVAESQVKLEEMQTGFQEFAKKELSKAGYLQQQLRLIPNAEKIRTPYIKFVRLPRFFGGLQHYGLPFTWQWRAILPEPEEFELCWAVHEIPEDDSFDIPVSHIHRSHLNLADGVSREGMLHGTGSDQSLDGVKPLEVNLFFRIDGDKEKASVSINYQISKPGSLNLMGGAVTRGEHIVLKPEELSWIGNSTTSRGSYGRISGFELEHDRGGSVPLIDRKFDMDEPLYLIKLRSKKEVSAGKFESYAGPCPGLMVWIQKKSGP